MLKEDPVAFEYLYLQSVSDVLQERFAVEMKCNTALRLAALHAQERLASSGQSLKTPLKAIMKEWGTESFVSHTLLQNMREKDLKKAISYHMKKLLSQEPKLKVISVNQARLNYLIEMSELKSYGGKVFSATMMLQDRESMVSLLVGAQYGMSQVINHKLRIMTTLTEFSCITKVELLPESERVSLVKIYLQDIKPITLLLESVAAKDLLCLVAGYCKLLVDRQICVFPWTANSKSHRISAEEGYVSHCGSDSEDSDTDMDALLAHISNISNMHILAICTIKSNEKAAKPSDKIPGATDKEQTDVEKGEVEREEAVEKRDREKVKETIHESIDDNIAEKEEIDDERVGAEKGDKKQQKKPEEPQYVIIVNDPSSEESDSYHTESHFMTSMSSDSIDALEEDDLMTYWSARRPCHLPVKDSYCCEDRYSPSFSPRQLHSEDCHSQSDLCSADSHGEPEVDHLFCFAALSNIVECLPRPPEANDEEDCEEQGIEKESHKKGLTAKSPGSAVAPSTDYVFTFEQGDTRHYYNICSNVTPDSARSILQPLSPPGSRERQMDQEGEGVNEVETVPNFQPPLGIRDSSSDDEFFDAQERFTSPEEPSSTDMTKVSEQGTEDLQKNELEKEVQEKVVTHDLSRFHKRPKKRRSFMETNYTSMVSFPEQDHLDNSYGSLSINNGTGRMACFDGGCSDQDPCPTISSLTHSEGEPAQLEFKPINPFKANGLGSHNPTETQVGLHANKTYQRKQRLIEMEPDSMESKSVTERMPTVSPTIVAVRSHMELQVTGNTSNHGSNDQEEGADGGLVERLFGGHLFFDTSGGKCDSSASSGQRNEQGDKQMECSFQSISLTQKSSSLPRLGQITPSSLSCFQVPTISYATSSDTERDDDTVRIEFGMGKQVVEPTERTRSKCMSATSDSGVYPPIHLFPHREAVVCPIVPESNETDSSCDPSTQDLSSGIPSFEPAQSLQLAPCSCVILGRLSASTLRGKIQNLPLYLSHSQEMLSNVSDNAKPARKLSETQLKINKYEVAKEASDDATLNEGVAELTEVKMVTIVSEELTEVIDEVREVSHCSLQANGQQKTKTEPKKNSVIPSPLCPRLVNSLQVSPSSVVVTTQNLNGPWGVVTSKEIIGLQEFSHPSSNLPTAPSHLTSGCEVFTNCQSIPTIYHPQYLLSPYEKPDFSCSSALAVGCEAVMESAQTPLEVCQKVYTNCFSGVLDSASFDDELTVYEFSHRTNQGVTEDALQMYMPPSSISASPASFSPSSPLLLFPHIVLPSFASTELSPLLFSLDTPDCFLSDPHEDVITALLTRRYPLPPTGFLSLQRDLDTLLSLLAGAMKNEDGVQEHPRDTCVAHFSENKRRLHVEARGLLAGCQRVVRVGQKPEETLQSLSQSFRSLVQLTSVCICFSSCQRCKERHAQSLTGLEDVAKTYQDFAREAELVGCATERKTCHDLNIKLLACKCTALTTSVFCLTQLFRTLTAL